MKCWRWLPWAMTTYSFQSSFLILRLDVRGLAQLARHFLLAIGRPGDLLAALGHDPAPARAAGFVIKNAGDRCWPASKSAW